MRYADAQEIAHGWFNHGEGWGGGILLALMWKTDIPAISPQHYTLRSDKQALGPQGIVALDSQTKLNLLWHSQMSQKIAYIETEYFYMHSKRIHRVYT